MTDKIKRYLKENREELYKILYELCMIPAPSHHEEKRAEYCKAWFLKNGMEEAYIDEALNVVYPYQAKDSQELVVFAAHTDTVFPDMEPLPYSDDGEKIFSPGVGDDTASVAVLMLSAKFLKENNVKTQGILFVCNSCEEGLGNLKGTREIFKCYEGRIKRFITFDSSRFNSSADRCVGSHRYEVEVLTVGGHSWSRFGNKNAIAALASIIGDIYSIDLPKKEGKRVTYNVGLIEGGTSVNTIAQNAKMICEYRSDDEELLAYMQNRFAEIFKSLKSQEVTVNVTLLGERPCEKGVNPQDMDYMRSVLNGIINDVVGDTVNYHSSSTDCNIPLSMGIPAISVGVYNGGGAHTREEWIDKESLFIGLEVGIRTVLGFME